MPESVALLRQLGFAEYEARSYLALLRQSPLNGYEPARASGVSRAARRWRVESKARSGGAAARHEPRNTDRCREQ